MDDGRLDRLEQALVLHARGRARTLPPAGFTTGVMRAVRANAERRNDFWSAFSFVARRFAPAGALAATATYGYAQMSERLLNQALLSLSLHGGAAAFTLAGLLP
ncbi:MAG: hypothetical protein Q7U56_08460 [Humidesulfovibrio sp.]|nr:hypothetical protein [Desulfovibrio sp.]MDO9083301.1 hypothetical protein [Humidesulfovibrio sp.]